MSARLLKTAIPRHMFRRLTAAEHGTVTYTNMSGTEVIGTLERVPQMRWMVIAEKSSETAFARVLGFRNVALLVVVLVLAAVAAIAYRLGQLIVRPLDRLAQGAAVVAMGDLDVDLPRTDRGEVGALTAVFNHMVARLREGREALARTNAELVTKNEELERLSVTDGLTGLTNHRALMHRLSAEAVRSKRTERPFTFLMADVDHFKQYNDAFGHPAGDDVLKGIARILTEMTRSVDCVARYGGEEFALLLPETDTSGAMEVAERIRARVEASEFPGRHVTMSIGLAEFPKDSADAAEIISRADQALYVAKEAGRNQIVQAARARRQKLPAAPRKKATKKKS
jgi:diguanylate cyclase (GGDEF)-like protein